MKTPRLLLAVVLALAPALHADVTQTWATRYNGSGNGDDTPTSVVVDYANDVIVTGYSTGFGNYDFYTAKYAAFDGAILWEKRYNGLANGDDRAKCVAVDSAGNVAVTGFSTGVGTGFDFYTAKYAADGTPLWAQRYDNGALDSANSVAMDSAGNVVVTGFSTGTGNYDFYTAKYAAADGALLWEKRYNGPTNRDDVPTSVAVDSADNVVVTGYSVVAAPYTNYYTAKYAAADGALLWEKSYSNGNTFSNPSSMVVDSSDNVVVTGSSGNGSSDDYYTAKYAAADGALLWEQRYNGPANASDVAAGVAVDSAGNVAVTGRSMGSGTNYDYYTAKYAAADGALLWEMRYNGNNSADDGAAIAMDSVGNVVVTGYSNVGGNASFYTASYAAADGQLLWENTYNGGLMLATGLHYLALAPDGSAVVTGQSPGVHGFDYATVRYGPPDLTTLPPLLTAPVSGALTKSPIGVAFSLPEPAANGTVKLTFAGATTTTLTLANAQGTSGEHSFTFNPANPTASTAIASGTAIADGTYTITLQYQDRSQNAAASASVSNVTIDTIAPDTTIDSGPPKSPGFLASTTATFTFSASEAGSTFLGSLDNGPYVAISSPKVYANLTQGAHIFNVQGVDAAGNADPTPAQRVFFVDTIAPNTTINSGPSGTVGSNKATFTFSANEPIVTFLGSFDGGAEVAVSSPAVFNGLAEGAHTFSVRAVDGAGNPDPTPATRTWTVDTIPPIPAIDSGPSGLVNSSVAVFAFSSNEAGSTFLGSLDGGAEVAVTSPKFYFDLTQGQHYFNVRAVDTAGNASPQPASRTWIVDTIRPDTTIDSGPNGTVSSSTATFTFSANEPIVTFLGSLDGGAEVAVSSPSVFNGLAEGAHTFSVRAVDGAGNADATPATRTWAVDTVPPETYLDDGPIGTVNSSTATFIFNAKEAGATFLASLDGGAEATVTSPKVYSNLAEGPHTFSVRAIDIAGNIDPTPETRAWIVDTIVPDTTITSGPSGTVNSTTATITFSATEAGVYFLGSLDGATEVVMPSPTVYNLLTEGSHTFSVRAVDAGGNVDPTPATRTWTTLFNPDNTAKHVRGAAVPGAGSGDIPAGAVWLDFGVPAINDAGALAFRGKWSSPAGVGTGIFVDDRLVAGTGDTTQALGPATLATFGEPVLDAAGHVAFVATVEGNGVTPARDSVLMADAFGALEVVAREGAAIGGPGSPKLKAFKSISLVDGEVLFTARLQGGTPAVTAANDFAALRMASPGSLGHVVRTGDRLGTTVVTAFNLLTAVAGSPGQNRGHAAGTATFLALLANGTQALVESTGGTLTPLAATGATTGGTMLPAATFKSFHIPAADGSGLAFVAALNPDLDGVTAASAQGIFKGEVGGIEPVARAGQATGVGATTFAALQNPVLAPGADSVAFPATLGGTTAARDASLWWQPAGAPLELLAREGAQPPGVAAGAKWAAFTSLALPGVTGAVGAPRGPLFLATMLPGVGGVDATNNAGVWAVDTSGELRLLFRKGAMVMGKKVKNFTVLNGVSGSPGVTRAFNDNGQVAWRAQFIDGTTAIVVTQVP